MMSSPDQVGDDTRLRNSRIPGLNLASKSKQEFWIRNSSLENSRLGIL